MWETRGLALPKGVWPLVPDRKNRLRGESDVWDAVHMGR